MEKEASGNGPTGLYEGLLGKALMYLGLFGFLSALVSFFILLPSTLGSTGIIMDLNPYTYFLLNLTSNPASVYAVLSISAVVVVISGATLFIGRPNLSVGIRKSNVIPFYAYFSVFILIELVLSFISPQVSPSLASDPVLKMPLAAQNFVFISSAVSQSFILEFVPVSIMVAAFLAIRGRFSLSTFLNPDRNLGKAEIPIIVITAVIASYLTSAGVGSGVLNFFSYLITTLIYVRFGLPRSIISVFTISQFNVILQFTQVPAIPYMMYIFLIIWSMAGIYGFTIAFTRNSREKQQKTSAAETGEDGTHWKREHEGHETGAAPSGPKGNPSNFWVRSPCPSCGGIDFGLHDDMSLECKNCHQIIEKEAVGEFSIRLVRSRV